LRNLGDLNIGIEDGGGKSLRIFSQGFWLGMYTDEFFWQSNYEAFEVLWLLGHCGGLWAWK